MTTLSGNPRHAFHECKVDKTIDLALASIAQHPTPRNLTRLASLYLYTKDFDQSQKYFDQALALDPNFLLADFEYCYLNFYRREYQEAWERFEQRFHLFTPLGFYIKQFGIRKLWTKGTSLDGKAILIHCEQGSGDTIQFARYLKCIKQKYRCYIILIAYKPLRDVLMASRLDIDQIIVGDPEGRVSLPRFDYFASLMSLPYLLGMDDPGISVPLEICLDRIGKKILPNGFNIIVCNSGCPAHRNDFYRSCPLSLFEYLSVPGVNLHLLHPSNDKWGMRTPHFFDWSMEIKDFTDTACYILGADLVISVDTAILHLAGSLRRETWGILSYFGEWRWGGEGETTPWYDTVRLYRQDTLGDWSSVFTRIKTDLEGKTK
jgi:tetratricopeptide (TPR) repeat protein